MGYLGRRIGLSQSQGDSNPGGAGGAVGGGLLSLLKMDTLKEKGIFTMILDLMHKD